MKFSLQTFLWAVVACFAFWPILALAQSSDDLARNPTDEALATHGRNVLNCRNGSDSCDRSTLTEPEATALALADHERNVSACDDGMQSCDPSKLTPSEARNSLVAKHRRNVTNCENGVGDCNPFDLTQPEVAKV